MQTGGDRSGKRVERKLAAILAADVVGYSRLIGVDEAGTLTALSALLKGLVEPTLTRHRGRIAKLMGDGLLAEFSSVVDAVAAAVDIQEAMPARSAHLPEDRQIALRIGVNMGDIVVEGGDIFGDGVNIAARLQELAVPNGVAISEVAHRELRGKLDLPFEDAGGKKLKNITEQVRVWMWPQVNTPSELSGLDDTRLVLPDKPSIAVMPFDNISGDPEQEYFSDGITEDIITELSKISGLFVIARHSVFTYKGKSVTLKQVGRELGVRFALEGSVRKAGKRLRITVQLIDTMTDHNMWVERYDRDLEDIFAVQDEVARNVAKALAVALKPEEGKRLSRLPAENIEAYDTYLSTRAALWPPTKENLLTARNAYQRIIETEPTFSGGHAGESMTRSFDLVFGYRKNFEEEGRIALKSAETSVALDDTFAHAHSALGLAHMVCGHHEAAIDCVKRAIELQPGDADVHLYATFPNWFAGNIDIAYETINTALRLDPQYVNGPYLNVLGNICFHAGRYEEAIDAFKENTDRGGPLAPPALAFRTAAYSAAGRMEEAKAWANTLLNFMPTFRSTKFPMLRMFRKQEYRNQFIEALRKAELPD
ncbi:MAG: hypothetical protein CMM55_06505 [Rhodospirillaceae bacterium]|nr:hypothetical protein [Rhodospirillaceae bacterium]